VEQPVVEKKIVPVERVRPGTEIVTENRQVRGRVRKDQLEEEATTRGRGDRRDA
jgi:hypothetical protein